MGVLLLIAASIVAGALFFFLVLRFIEFVSLLALIGVSLAAIGITSLAVSEPVHDLLSKSARKAR